MKKENFTRFMALSISLLLTVGVAHSQLRVRANGNAQIGDPAKVMIGGISLSPQKVPSVSIAVQSDSVATLTLFGTSGNGAGASLHLGNDSKIGIKDVSSCLNLFGANGFRFSCGNDTVAKFNAKASSKSFEFKYDVRARGVILSSDVRLKSDVRDLEDECSLLGDLNPVSFRFKESLSDSLEEGMKSKKSSNSSMRYGFIAQEVRKIYPELVYEDEDGTLGIDYISFIPLLVDAVKGLQAKVEELSGNPVNEMYRTPQAQPTGLNELESITVIRLYQNTPNPFNENTLIRCDIPEEVSQASIFVYDLQGTQVLRRDIIGHGPVSVSVKGNELHPGMYLYTLVADGQAVDSKRMILTD